MSLLADQRPRDLLPFRLRDVERHGTLIPIDANEIGAFLRAWHERRCKSPRVVPAAGLLNLDHVGAQDPPASARRSGPASTRVRSNTISPLSGPVRLGHFLCPFPTPLFRTRRSGPLKRKPDTITEPDQRGNSHARLAPPQRRAAPTTRPARAGRGALRPAPHRRPPRPRPLRPSTFPVVNPATGETEIGTCRVRATPADVEAAVADAERAQKDWAKLPARKRGALVGQCAALLTEHQEELARLIALETGKALRTESRVEAGVVADIFRVLRRPRQRAEGRERSLRPQRPLRHRPRAARRRRRDHPLERPAAADGAEGRPRPRRRQHRRGEVGRGGAAHRACASASCSTASCRRAALTCSPATARNAAAPLVAHPQGQAR